MLKEVSRYSHNCCRMAYLSLFGPNMDPSWLKLAQVGHMLDASWLQFGSSWIHVGPRSEFPVAPEPTQALPNSFFVASGPPKTSFVPYKTQHRLQKGSQTSNSDLYNSQICSRKTPTWFHNSIVFAGPSALGVVRSRKINSILGVYPLL